MFKASVGLLWCILWLVVGYEKPENHPKISEKELEYIRRNRVENHHLTTVICVTNSDFTMMKAARNFFSKHHNPNLFATTTFPCCAGLAFECTVCIFNQWFRSCTAYCQHSKLISRNQCTEHNMAAYTVQGCLKPLKKIRMQFKAKLITETEFRQIKFKDPKKG